MAADVYWQIKKRGRQLPTPAVLALAEAAFPWDWWAKYFKSHQIDAVRFQIAEDGQIACVQARLAGDGIHSVSEPSSVREAFEEIQRQLTR